MQLEQEPGDISALPPPARSNIFCAIMLWVLEGAFLRPCSRTHHSPRCVSQVIFWAITFSPLLVNLRVTILGIFRNTLHLNHLRNCRQSMTVVIL